MLKYILSICLLTTTLACANEDISKKHHKMTQVIYSQVDSMYLEAVVNDILRYLNKNHYKIKDIKYKEIDGLICSFMIVYE